MLQSCRGQQVGAGIRCQMTGILKGEGLQRTQNPSLGGGTVLDALTSPFFFFLQEEKVQLWRGLGVRRGQARVSSARG